MNVTDLARQLRMNTKELLDLLPEYGFDIGKRAIKIDDRTAQQIMRQWSRIKRDIDKKRLLELEENKKKEREMRKESGRMILLPDKIVVKEFSGRLDLPVTEVIRELMKNGILANQNQYIDYETAGFIAEELGFSVGKEAGQTVDHAEEAHRQTALEEAIGRATMLERRAPVVVVMGHVDHGKTSLLDTIRKANIVSTESGGITQHIGAYQTIWKDPKTEEERAITFIDTPGHEAFTVMRSRGAKVADIAILIVAADDGVKPQTVEVIQIIKAAKVPYVVAINKIDKEGADIQRVKTELSEQGIIPEEWGGDAPVVEISAKKQLHIDKLLDTILLMADLREAEIVADASMPAVGTVIESNVDKHMGPVATILVQSGTLHKGDDLVVNGEIYGRVRAMRDYTGANIDTAGPSVPAQIIGFKVAPQMGDILDVAKAGESQKIDVKAKQTQQTGAEQAHVISANQNDNRQEDAGKSAEKVLNILVKSDVLGSLEAIIGALERFRHDEVAVKVIGKGLGNMTESDVAKAEATGATLVGFHVHPTPTAEQSIRDKKIPFERFEVIYALMDWVKDKLEKMLDQEKIITELGIVKILAIFRTDKHAMTVGGRVEDGKVVKGSLARVKRDGEILGEGKIVTCQQGKQESKEVFQGIECGMRFEGKIKIEVGDVFEIYSEERKAKKIVFG